MKKFYVFLSAFLILLLTSCGGYTNINIDSDYKYDNATMYTASHTCNYQKNEITSVNISWVYGTISIYQVDNASYNVSETNDSEEESKTMHYAIIDNALYIKCFENGYKIAVGEPSKTLNIEIPLNVALKINGVSCDVRSTNIKSPEDIKADLVSGSFIIDDIESEKNININSISAYVSLGKATAKELYVSSVSGTSILSNVKAEKVDIDTVSGNANVELGIAEMITFNSVSASLEVKKSSDHKVYAKLSTVSGKITGEYVNNIAEAVSTKIEAGTISGDVKIFNK